MHRDRISELCQHIPDKRLPNNTGLLTRMVGRIGIKAAWINNPQFGYDFARVFAQSRQKLPLVIGSAERWICEAYRMEKDGVYSEAVSDAISWVYPPLDHIGTAVSALLLARDATVPKVAGRLGLPLESVEAYEQLFFNVLDRKSDITYLTSIVYPQGRMVEMLPDYFLHEKSKLIIFRAAYNNSMDDALYFLGARDTLRTTMDSTKDYEDLMMSTALVFGRNGGLLHRGAKPIDYANRNLAAIKQGGEANQTTQVGANTLFSSYYIDTKLKPFSENLLKDGDSKIGLPSPQEKK
jgi:hypothetical protein